MIQAFLVIRILEKGNVFQEYGNDNIFKGVELLYSMEWGLMLPIVHGVKGFLPPEITGLLNKLRASVLSMP